MLVLYVWVCVNYCSIAIGVYLHVCNWVSLLGEKVQFKLLKSQLLTVVSDCLFTFSILHFPPPQICMFLSLCCRYAVCGCPFLAPSCFTVCQLTSVIFLGDKARSCLYLLVSGSQLWVCVKVWLWIILYVILSHLLTTRGCLFDVVPCMCASITKCRQSENYIFAATIAACNIFLVKKIKMTF